jgi:hypothetical protein
LVALPTQIVQPWHASHRWSAALAKRPLPQDDEDTQAWPSRYVLPVQDVQVVAAPEHVAQPLEHASQRLSEALANVLVGQADDDTHVLPVRYRLPELRRNASGQKSVGGLRRTHQLVQDDPEPEQLAQGDVQARQCVPLAKVPDGQVATHVLPFKRLPVGHEVHDVADPEQDAHGA